MSDVVARLPSARAAVPRVSALRAAVSSDALVVTGLAVWMIVLTALTWGRWGDLTMDTGYDLLAGTRTAHGELPFVDYQYFYGPLSPLLLGGVYAISGPGLWPAIALGLVLAVLAVGLTYRLARLFVEPLPAGMAAALTAPLAVSGENSSYVLPHATSAPLAFVFTAVALLWLAQHARGPTGRWRLPAAGVACGLVAITRPEAAAALYASVTAWLLLRGWRSTDRRRALGEAGSVLVGACAIPIAVYGAFLTQLSLHDLVRDNLYPVDFLDAAGSVVLQGHAPLTTASFATLAGKTLAYAAGCACLLVLARAFARPGRRRAAAGAAVAMAGIAFAAVLVARPDTVRFYLAYAYAWIPAGALAAAVVVAWRGRDARAWTGELQSVLLVVLVLGLAAGTTYASFRPYPNPLHPDATTYLLGFVAVFLAWLHVRMLPRGRSAAARLGTGWLALLVLASGALVVHDARKETTEVRGVGGSLHARPAEAGALQSTLDLIARETRPDDAVLIAPQLTALYVMSDRRDPLPQLSLLPGMLADPGAERRAIAAMGDVRLAVIDRTPLTLYEHGAFGETFAQTLGAWLRRDFTRIATLRGVGADARTIDVFRRGSR